MDSAHSPEVSSLDDAVLYVEELASADDYWLSITDAARVCRVQDVSIRRAINRKSLPVRRQRAGQNKRTRFVRASDLERAGFPIIDENAVITTEIGKVDVLSIPRQQQQIVQDHQALMLKWNEMREMLANQQQQMEDELRQQQEHFQAAQEEQTRLLATAQEKIGQEQEKFQRALAEARQHFTTEQQMLRQDLTQEHADALTRAEHTQTDLANLRQGLEQAHSLALARDEQLQQTVSAQQIALRTGQEEARGQLIHLAETQQQALATYQQTVEAALQRVEQEAQQRLGDVEQRVTAGLQQLAQDVDARLINLRQTLTQIQQSHESLRQSIMVRDLEVDREFQRQQALLHRYEQLMPLLPYTRQHLLVEQDIATWSQALIDLEARLRVAQQHEFEHYRPLQPLLDVLSPERLAVLTRLLINEEGSNTKNGHE